MLILYCFIFGDKLNLLSQFYCLCNEQITALAFSIYMFAIIVLSKPFSTVGTGITFVSLSILPFIILAHRLEIQANYKIAMQNEITSTTISKLEINKILQINEDNDYGNLR